MKKIILASQSPRRKQLLEWAEIDFDVITSDITEDWPEGMPLNEIPIHIARNKALDVKKSDSFYTYPTDTPIVAADTVVIIQDKILGKPASRDEAIFMLSSLSGRSHHVITGVVILKGEDEYAFAETTEVNFHDLSKQEIENYVDQYKPFDKAGSYAIQEWIGVVGIKGIHGDFYNVMGLPVSRVVRLLYSL
ncbi:MAG: Maf family nucleotide pyrophosphatase [Chitinophagaceae bacterium]